MKLNVLLILFLLSLSFKGAQAKERLNDRIIDEYLKLQSEFSTTSCKAGTEALFKKFDRDYRGDGNFIPVMLDEKVDLKTIKSLIPLMKEKGQWIQTQIETLSKLQDMKAARAQIDKVESELFELQALKKEHYFTNDTVKKAEIEKRAQAQFTELLKDVETLKDQVPFLLSFKFPVNHLGLRSEYEKFKMIATKEGRARSNSVYLFRKIVQDGSYDEELVKNDAVIRSAFDTLYLSLTKEQGRKFLTDAERVDLRFVLRNFDKFLSYKAPALIGRFNEWKGRSDRAVQFYEDLLEGKKIKLSEESQIKDVTSLLEDRARSLYTLKEFVLSREASAYEFWSKKSELMQALYAIETILYSEVGRMDAPDALERKDVTQVVINRYDNSSYNSLSERDTITKFLSPSVKTLDNRWLNVLFKEGEFSFTYFYIPGNFHIYCPDMSRMGQYLRRENVRIALEYLNRPKPATAALRYFSRTSMFGRIEMDSLWNDFRALPEVPGTPVPNAKKIYHLFLRDQYTFLYDFTNEEHKKKYLVVELKGKTYVVDSAHPKSIYHYRNPHQFKYFAR